MGAKNISWLLLLHLTSIACLTVNFGRNECKEFLDYYTRPINDNCRHSPIFYKDIPHILETLNHSYEKHSVTTEDGYIVSSFRILTNNPKGVIAIGPPIMTDASIWFLGDNASYVETFHKAGYEVWLVNWRGLKFSDKHEKNVKSSDYWRFSFHEMGVYDCSSIIKHIHNITGSKVTFLTMSMGSSAATIYAAEKVEETKEFVNLFISMGVPAFMQKSNTPLRLLIPIKYLVMPIQRIFGLVFFYKTKPITDIFTRLVLLFNLIWVEALIVPVLIGGKASTFDPLSLPLGASITPQPTSIQTLLHYVQLLTNGNKFVAYDHGKRVNRIKYNTDEPPRYHVENISVPFFIIYGSDDLLANAQGNELLYDKLPAPSKIYGKLELPGAGHADFISGRTQPSLIQSHVLDLLSKIN